MSIASVTSLYYTSQNFEELLSDIDVVVETSSVRNNAERLKAISVLKFGGTFISVNVDFPADQHVLTALSNKQVKGEFPAYQPRQEWLEEIANLIDNGEVNVFINEVFPMEKIADAHKKSESGNVPGKLILEIKK